MIDFLINLIPVSLCIWGIHILFQEGHIFEQLGDWMDEKLPEGLNKPLWACPVCMSSIWGTAGYFILGLHYHYFFPFIFCLCGLNTIILKLTSNKRVIEQFDGEAFRQMWDLMKVNDQKLMDVITYLKNEKEKNTKAKEDPQQTI